MGFEKRKKGVMAEDREEKEEDSDDEVEEHDERLFEQQFEINRLLQCSSEYDVFEMHPDDFKSNRREDGEDILRERYVQKILLIDPARSANPLAAEAFEVSQPPLLQPH